MMVNVILDTDIGGDIDDALALSMALHASEIRLLGITTVYIANEWRCGVLRNMLMAYGRQEIPVFHGAEKPLNGNWGQREKADDGKNAAAWIIAQAKAQKVAVVCIGPITNLAQALRMAPEIAANMEIYAMGGRLSRLVPEWNLKCDPEAAHIVLSSGAPVTLVGLDVTERCRLTREKALALVAGESPEMRCLQGEMARFFEKFSFLPTLHDPLTLLCLLEPEWCNYEWKNVSVELKGENRGALLTQEQAPLIRAAVSVREKQAVRRIWQRVRGEERKAEKRAE